MANGSKIDFDLGPDGMVGPAYTIVSGPNCKRYDPEFVLLQRAAELLGVLQWNDMTDLCPACGHPREVVIFGKAPPVAMFIHESMHRADCKIDALLAEIRRALA